jgi:hypothetical protein
VLAPQRPAVELLTAARRKGDISAEDLKEVFYISYEMAAHRLTNLATHHLGLAVHFLRTDDEGVIWKAYENDGVPFPTDSAGMIEGQRACRKWGTRQAFGSHDKFAEYAQYTESPAWARDHLPDGLPLPRWGMLPAAAVGRHGEVAGPGVAGGPGAQLRAGDAPGRRLRRC